MDRSLFFVAALMLGGCSASSHAGVHAARPTSTCAGGVVHGDAELARYVGCRSVGHLDVRGVSTLAPLRSLERVDGTLRIEQTDELYSLAGLERLRSVDTLVVRDNAALISAGALGKLGHVRLTRVSNNPRLTKTYGLFDAIGKSGGSVYLSKNSGLTAEGVPESDVLSSAVAAR